MPVRTRLEPGDLGRRHALLERQLAGPVRPRRRGGRLEFLVPGAELEQQPQRDGGQLGVAVEDDPAGEFAAHRGVVVDVEAREVGQQVQQVHEGRRTAGVAGQSSRVR